jgi:hypothetical protein
LRSGFQQNAGKESKSARKGCHYKNNLCVIEVKIDRTSVWVQPEAATQWHHRHDGLVFDRTPRNDPSSDSSVTMLIATIIVGGPLRSGG